MACYTALMRGRPARWTRRQRGQPVHEWIDQNLAPPDANGCRLWLRAKNPKGYGVIGIDTTTVRQVSRVLWAHVHGPIPPGMLVCHRCDVRACCEITHLFLGTNADNMHDCNSKGRRPRGESHCHAVLTDEAVRSIRRRYADGTTQTEMAREYGVNNSVISNVCTRTTWRHLE